MMTLDEIGRAMRLSKERVRQIQDQGIARIAKRLGITFDEATGSLLLAGVMYPAHGRPTVVVKRGAWYGLRRAG